MEATHSHTSSRSSAQGGACVEVTTTPVKWKRAGCTCCVDQPDYLITDSTIPGARRGLVVPTGAMAAFVDAIKAGEFRE